MTTRAIYTFKDGQKAFHIYKNYDNTPAKALIYIENAFKLRKMKKSIEMLAASFIIVNGNTVNDVPNMSLLAPSEIESHPAIYRYEISWKDDSLHIVAYSKDLMIFSGSFERFKNFVEIANFLGEEKENA